jgi:peptidoglycan/LPS O-acetylase OafA/YrhL
MYQKRTFVTMEASRGIAAICVMLNHYTGANLFPNPIAPDFFWCLSGFVIASSYEQKLEGGMPVREFLRRRLIRVYPMYILGTFVGLLAIIMMLRAEPLHPRFGSIALATISSILILPYLLPLSVPCPCVSMAAFGRPVVPEVKKNQHGSSCSTSAGGVARPRYSATSAS